MKHHFSTSWTTALAGNHKFQETEATAAYSSWQVLMLVNYHRQKKVFYGIWITSMFVYFFQRPTHLNAAVRSFSWFSSPSILSLLLAANLHYWIKSILLPQTVETHLQLPCSCCVMWICGGCGWLCEYGKKKKYFPTHALTHTHTRTHKSIMVTVWSWSE